MLYIHHLVSPDMLYDPHRQLREALHASSPQLPSVHGSAPRAVWRETEESISPLHLLKPPNHHSWTCTGKLRMSRIWTSPAFFLKKMLQITSFACLYLAFQNKSLGSKKPRLSLQHQVCQICFMFEFFRLRHRCYFFPPRKTNRLHKDSANMIPGNLLKPEP